LINLSTGPLELSSEVREALFAQPIPHRGSAFKAIFKNLTDFISNHVSVRETFILTGSGTLANEVMLQQIKGLGSKGLILNSGEFGNRLCKQAHRLGIPFMSLEPNAQNEFVLKNIEAQLDTHKLSWILFCHCETSTGVAQELKAISDLAKHKGVLAFVDCMSTFGTTYLNLENVAMATASSGKGICSAPGLALIFCNLSYKKLQNVPSYFDLNLYKDCAGVPFTISSNSVSALNVAAIQNLNTAKYNLLNTQSYMVATAFNYLGILPYHKPFSRVFTFQPLQVATQLGNNLLLSGITSSYESSYHLEKNWLQLALFGNYDNSLIVDSISVISAVLREK